MSSAVRKYLDSDTCFVVLALCSSTLGSKWNNDDEVAVLTFSFNLRVFTGTLVRESCAFSYVLPQILWDAKWFNRYIKSSCLILGYRSFVDTQYLPWWWWCDDLVWCLGSVSWCILSSTLLPHDTPWKLKSAETMTVTISAKQCAKPNSDYCSFDRHCDCNMSHEVSGEGNFCISFSLIFF